MPIPSIVKKIGQSLEERRKGKKEIDESVNLSNLSKPHNVTLSSSAYSTDKPIRLLDEGAIMYEGGKRVRLYFMKGVLENFYNSLSDDFVGYINLAHIDVWSLPLNLGTWSKQDLSIVDIGDGRKGLEVKATLNRDLSIVNDLLKQEIPLSVSAELQCNIDWNKSFKLGFYCVDKIDILGFSVVGNPANVNSSDVNLKIEGEEEMDLEKLKEFLSNKENKDVLNVEKQEKLEEKDEKEQTEKVELSEEQLDILDKFMEKFTALQEENKELKEQISQLNSDKQEEKKSKVDDVISKLESLLNNDSKKEEKLGSDFDYMGLGNLDKESK